MERSPGAGFAGRINIPVMVLGDLPAHRQADTRAGIFILTVKPFENTKDLLRMLLVEPDAIVADPDMMIDVFGFGCDDNNG